MNLNGLPNAEVSGLREMPRRSALLPGYKGKLTKVACHLLFVGLLDLLGLREGVFPGVELRRNLTLDLH